MIYVKDLPKMREFDSAVLGAGPVNQSWTDTWAGFNAGQIQISSLALQFRIAALAAAMPARRARGRCGR
jgi:hypothetical protein